jgi:tetratricopeptide (TPR) repeat protein
LEGAIVGNWKFAARAALAMFAFGGITLAAGDRVTAKERSGCINGPLKSVGELDGRIAACTLTIDTSRSAAQIALALSYRAQAFLSQNKCDLAIEDLNRAREVSPSKKSSTYYDVHLWISYYWQNCRGDFDRGLAVLNEAAAMLPRDPAVYNQRANMYRDKGDYGAAIADINRSIALINNDLTGLRPTTTAR